jgi:integrase
LRPLSPQAYALIPAGGGERVFPGVRNLHYPLAELHKASGTSGWTLHDLRRTARTLMSRAGVAPDIGERCLGHVISGVRGVYDRFEYRDEKAEAYEKLAALVERIVNPVDNVTAIAGRR